MRGGFVAPARRADKMPRERSPSAERSTANPEIPPARNSVRTPRSRTNPLDSVRRGLLGFAGLAPHSGRSSVPFRLTLFRDRRYFPSNLNGSQQLGAAPLRAKSPLTNIEV